MIVIPMAGLSSRFFAAGYTEPKYQLNLWGHTVFKLAVLSFKNLFNTEKFLFIVRMEPSAVVDLHGQIKAIGIVDYEIIALDAPTKGQAETVQLGIERSTAKGSERLTIFNIDTIRPNFRHPAFVDVCDGYLEVFEGEGTHWSFVEPIGESSVRRTTEKDRISSLCSDGLYHFKTADLYSRAYHEAIKQSLFVKGEIYVAPLYNVLIADGCDIRYQTISSSDIYFCGTPTEYEALKGIEVPASISAN